MSSLMTALSGETSHGNWQPKTGNDHAFDTGKMVLCLKDFALASLSRKRYRIGQAPSIVRRFDRQTKKQEQKQQTDVKNSFWQI